MAIIPARGGSQGVRQKNVRLLSGRPLIAYTIDAARNSGVFDEIVVSTDDDVIALAASGTGVTIHRRSPETAAPDATIGQAAAAVIRELAWDGPYTAVLQPTSPFRTAYSIRAAFEQFHTEQLDSLMTVHRQRHLHWLDADGTFQPLFAERVNRQFGDHHVLQETGSIQFVRTGLLADTSSMVQPRHGLHELPTEEALDIDTIEDLAVARFRMQARGTVVFRLTANRLVGTGHLYHCLQLAQELDDLRVHFLLRNCDAFAADLVAASGYSFEDEVSLTSSLERVASESERCLLVNDILDTTLEDVAVPKMLGYAVACVEDLGVGAQHADVVVNALYAPAPARSRALELTGAAYSVLRPEFAVLPPRSSTQFSRVLVTFGGADPARLTARVAATLRSALPDSIQVSVVLGIAAPDAALPDGVDVTRTPKSMAREMAAADVIVTSAGRTVFEAAAAGTPVVVVAQNAREATHTHLSYDHGVIFLGLGATVSSGAVSAAVTGLLSDPTLRSELSERLQRSVPRDGAERVANHLRSLLLRTP